MNSTVGLAQSHDLFLAHVNRQFLCSEMHREREREGEMDLVMGEGLSGH